MLPPPSPPFGISRGSRRGAIESRGGRSGSICFSFSKGGLDVRLSLPEASPSPEESIFISRGGLILSSPGGAAEARAGKGSEGASSTPLPRCVSSTWLGVWGLRCGVQGGVGGGFVC